MERIFANGLIAKRPEGESAKYVKLKVSVKVGEFIEFLDKHQNNGWVNIDLKESREGKLYFELNTWKPGTTEKYKSPNVESEISAQKEMYGDYRPEDNGEERTEIEVEKIPF